MEALNLNLTEHRGARDGKAYTFAEYVDFYGFQCALTLWQTNSAEQPVDTNVGHTLSLNLTERRVARDGDAYTFAEYADFYGFQSALTLWQTNSAEQPVDINRIHLQNTAEQSVAITASQPKQQDILLSWNELEAMSSTIRSGGKEAAKEQRRLRQHCFAHGLWDVDLSKCDFAWKHLLKNLPASESQRLVGAGIVKFSFRLLRDVSDHNYIKVDSGEKHVFEIECIDGERWQLHFHKNGHLDTPFRIAPPSSMPQAVQHGQSACSAARPAQYPEEGFTWHLQNILEATAQYSAPVGRNEASMALATILQNYSPQQFPFAVDITDTVVFPWHRWLRNVVQNRELIGCGIVKVFAFWHRQCAKQQLIFCHPDDTCTQTWPGYKLQFQQNNGWKDEPAFIQAPIATESWLQLRSSTPAL